jgi:hypothetical protein
MNANSNTSDFNRVAVDSVSVVYGIKGSQMPYMTG